MSIDYCPECDTVVEGSTVEFECPGCEETYRLCYCGAEVHGLSEDDPRDER